MPDSFHILCMLWKGGCAVRWPLCILAILLCTGFCYAQVEGIVRDAADHEVLPFTSVYNLTTSKGVYTDIDGAYRVEAKQGDVLQFSYVGYTKQKVTVGKSLRLDVKLKPDNYALGEVVVHPGANPAHRIINHAIANRAKHNPDNRKSYSCTLYNKLAADVDYDSIAKPKEYAKTRRDTGSHILLNEAVVKREYRYSGNVSEHIAASRTSGFGEYQQMAFLQILLQFFHFYHDVLAWKLPERFYLNPISPGSTSKYFFLLRDTVVSGVDSTFIISYQPRRSANFDGLKGLLYINSNGWAIQSVVAEPADYSPFCLKIQQQYALADSVWFPSELSLELFLRNMTNAGINFVYRGKSHIADIDLSPDLSNRNFKSYNVTMADDVHLKPELIDRYRNTELTAREDSTYRKYGDTLDIIFRIMEGAIDNLAIPVKIFDFPFEKIVQQNYTEGFRLGLGAYTNRHLSPWFSAGGYWGHGFKDRRNKYGASFAFFPEKHLDSEIKIWYANDLRELTLSNEAGLSARKLWGKFNIEAGFKVQDIHTAFDYSYEGLDMSSGRRRNAVAGLNLRYAHNEERMTMFRRTLPVFTTHPVLYLNVYLGIPDCFGSEYRYMKAEAGAERRWHIRNAGTVTLSVWGGWMNSDTPFPLTFTLTDTEQSLFLTLLSRTRFNALTGDIYSAGRYVNAFIYHDFGTLLGKTSSNVFRPRIAVAQAFGWSKLNRPERHASADFNILDMHRGYFENGLVIEDIIRFEYLNMFFIGLGGGVYGAYGGSVQKPFVETLTPKIRVSVSF